MADLTYDGSAPSACALLQQASALRYRLSLNALEPRVRTNMVACGRSVRTQPSGWRSDRVREGRRESVPRFGRCFIGMRARAGAWWPPYHRPRGPGRVYVSLWVTCNVPLLPYWTCMISIRDSERRNFVKCGRIRLWCDCFGVFPLTVVCHSGNHALILSPSTTKN